MPLIKSGSKQAVSENIRREMDANKPQKQAVAIALDVARRAGKASGGSVGYADGGAPDDAKIARQIQERAMHGLDPTPEQQDYLRRVSAIKNERSQNLGEFGWELTGIPQAQRAGTSIGEAIEQPSIANVTNAGVNTAMAFGKPLAATGMGLGGLGAAFAKDAGLFDFGAHAQGKKGPEIPQIEGLTPKQNKELFDLEQRAKAGAWSSYDERKLGIDRIKELRAVSNNASNTAISTAGKAEADKAAAELGEYNRMVGTAESARDAELARRRRFSDTDVGKVWDKLGGWGPAVVGAGAGLSSRLATGPGSGSMGHLLNNYALPGAMAALSGGFSTNIPLAYNAFMTEPDNPEKRGYEAYARELPPNHPRKGEWAQYAKDLPEENPVRTAAAKELYDVEKAKERMIFGGGEGLAGGLFGSEMVRAPGRLMGAKGASPKAPSEPPAMPSRPMAGPEHEGLPGMPMRAEPLPSELMPTPRSPASPEPERLVDRMRAQNQSVRPSEASSLPAFEPPYEAPEGKKWIKPHVRAVRQSSKKPEAEKPKAKKIDADTVPRKPVKDFDPEDESRLTRGMKRGGAVRRALDVARRAMGGRVHTGPIQHVADGGRTDTAPMDVPSGAYVIPADIVSSMGQGDTNAGYHVLDGMLGPAHTRAEGGAIPIIAAGGEYVMSPEQVARIGNGDVKMGHEALDQWVKMQRRKAIQTLRGLPGPARD